MKCHYEVLNVPRDADLAEIKAAYKRLALKWHPDKNLNNQEYAKEQFQVVQQAYEVLSDKQERAWYDNHREQILRGSNSDYEDVSLDVFPYFTASCFKGYGDDEGGFYHVYGSVFEKIAKEDLEHMDDKEEFCNIPMFGSSQSDYEEVVKPFYDYWMSYSTKKSYVWLDPINIKELRDRKSVKLAEKENKKIRQQARKERNEEVRALVAFVRKRDKRVQAHLQLMETKKLENKQKVEQLKLQKKLERKEQLSQGTSEVEWAKFDNLKSALKEIEKNLAEEFCEELSNSEDEEVKEDENNLYCVACNKVFKTPKTFKNHELSKKHKENVATLKEEMFNEENSSQDEEILSVGEDAIDEDGCESESEEEKECNKSKKKKQKNKILIAHSDDDAEAAHIAILTDIINDLSDSDFDSAKEKKKKAKKNGNKKSKSKISKTKENDEEQDFDEIEQIVAKKCKKRPQQIDIATIDVDTSHCCVTCKNYFSSKNKLFEHLKKSGHSVYLPNSKITQSKQKNKSIK